MAHQDHKIEMAIVLDEYTKKVKDHIDLDGVLKAVESQSELNRVQISALHQKRLQIALHVAIPLQAGVSVKLVHTVREHSCRM